MSRRRPPSRAAPHEAELRDRPVSWGWRVPMILMLPLAAATPFLLEGRSEAVERYYSRGVYPYVSSLLGLASDWAPLSVAEILLFALVVWVFLTAFRTLADVVRGQRTLANVSYRGLATTLTLVGALAGLWLFLWGLNYQRRPFADSVGLEVGPASVSELEELCEGLMGEAAEARSSLAVAPDGVMVLRGGRDDCLARAASGYSRASKRYPILEWNYARPKPAVLSPLLSRLGVPGIFSPLTGEPHVNRQVTDSELPFTASHELAHQIGFAREDEANFLALVACASHPDDDFRYSGALRGFLYAMNALARVDPGRSLALWTRCPEGVRLDVRANDLNWERYESPAREVARAVNDTYLKTAGEPKGIESYGEVVDLMLAERRRALDRE